MIKLGIVAAALLIIALVVCAPLAVIWALNTLFLLSIPYAFKTWCAVLLLCLIFNGPRKCYESN